MRLTDLALVAVLLAAPSAFAQPAEPPPPAAPDLPVAAGPAEAPNETTPPPSDAGTLHGDTELRVPVQMPVPEPPAPPLPTGATRENRLLDMATELPALVARQGGMARTAHWGGVADDLSLRGATGSALSDLSVTLDGLPLAVPLAGRGPGAVDLELLPISGIESVEVRPGPFDGSYGGTLALQSRRLRGVDGGVLLGERGARRLGMAAGLASDKVEALLALETRSAQQLGAGDDRTAALGLVGTPLAPGLMLRVGLRMYREAWDESIVAPAVGSDGGELNGVGASAALEWSASSRTRIDLVLGGLDDRSQRFATANSEQTELRNRDRVALAGVHLTSKPDWPVPAEIQGGFDLGYDHARSRSFLTEARTRLGTLERIEGDWLRAGAWASTDLGFGSLHTGLLLRADQLTIRRDDPARDAVPSASSGTLPSGALWVRYEAEAWSVTARVGQGFRTHPEALLTDSLALDTQSGELTVAGRIEVGRAWNIAWQVGGFAALYERGVGDLVARGQERAVFGGELGLDVQHRLSGLILAARGGPMYSIQNGWGDDRDLEPAPGVPNYVAHLGLLRPSGDGLRGEVWLDAYGGYAVDQGPKAAKTDPVEDAQARVGYSRGGVTVWVGGEHVLEDHEPVLLTDGSQLLVQRHIFVLLDVQL